MRTQNTYTPEHVVDTFLRVAVATNDGEERRAELTHEGMHPLVCPSLRDFYYKGLKAAKSMEEIKGDMLNHLRDEVLKDKTNHPILKPFGRMRALG